VIARFRADQTHQLHNVTSWSDLSQRLDQLRPNDNVFTAVRIHGTFEAIKIRVACKAAAGTDLVTATSHQAEFRFGELAGTLVGFWSPNYARTINIPGYHLHLLSDDHAHGGHLLELRAKSLRVELHTQDHLHLALPDTAGFLATDLQGDPRAALAQAEGDHA
jgi:acetolactate decarboxylase